MKQLMQKCKNQLIALAVLGAGLLLFRLLRPWTAGMDFFAQYISSAYKHFMGFLCSAFPFSMMEVVLICFVLFCLFFLGKSVRDILRAPQQRLAALTQKLLSAGVIVLAVYGGFTILWGVNYYTTPFEAKANIAVQPVSVQQLTQVTQLFAEKVNASANAVKRDENDVFAQELDTIFADSKMLYQPIETQYPFLQSPPRAAKKMPLFSWYMSVTNYTGIFFPFTGEANVNIDAPACFIPSTIAHELAHVRDIAPEQTANFVAILACEKSGNAAYTYSGALLGYLHLSNALYTVDRAAWAQISQQLCVQAQADLADNNAYWAQYDTVAATAANKVYEGFLQSYDQKLGLKSYGAVVDLLIAYYA